MPLSTPLNCHVMALRLLILTLVTSRVCVSNFHVHATTSTSSSTSHCTEYNEIINEIPCRDNIWGPVQWRRSLSESNADDYDEAYFYQIQDHLDARRTLVEDTVFVSYQFHYAYQQPPSTTANTNEEPTNARSNPFPSTWYTYPDLLSTLLPMSINGVGAGPSSKHFYLGQVSGRSPSSSASTSLVYGLVNLAAFLSHAMTVSIQYDVCDEFHVDDQVESQFAIANSCGQFGRDNQLVDIVGDSACRGIGAGAGEVNDDGSTTIMIEACPVELNASVTGVTSLWGERSPPPLQCGPKESEDDYTGYWDVRDGVLYENYPFANRAGRIHNEGCCWWGRGILMTRGTCNFGKLNYYLGKSAASQGFLNWFDVDFCVYPEIVCDGAKELRWATGYFEWMDRVQDYVNMTSGWGYLHELEAFVERNFDNHTGFIDMVGHALPYGCSEEKCEAIEAKVAQERRDNFQMLVFDVLEVPKLVKTPAPSRRPTNQPVAFIDPVDPSEGPSNNENVPPNDGPSVQTTEYPMFVGRPITPTPVSPQIPSGSVQTNSPMVDIPETPPILTPVNPPSMTNNPKPTSTLTPTAAPVKNPVNPQSEPPETPPIVVPPQPPSPPTPPGGLSTTPPPTIKITDPIPDIISTPPPTQLPENPATIVVVERPTYMPTYLDTSLITLQSGSNSNMKRNSSLLGFPLCLFFLLLLR